MKTLRDHIVLYINGERKMVTGPAAFLPLSSYLRYEEMKTGTKVVCAEGDCGACSVLISYPSRKTIAGLADFRAMNSCIAPVYLLDGASVVTVEGLKKDSQLCEVQKKMVECQGSQCGFCTPGFVVALSAMFEAKKQVRQQDVKNYTTGNLCRCTGYLPIVNAAMAVDISKVGSVKKKYLTESIKKDLIQISKKAFQITTTEKQVHGPTNLKEVSKLLVKYKKAIIISSATDLGVQYNKEKTELDHMITLHLIPELFELKKEKSGTFVGAKVDLASLQKQMKANNPSFAKFLRLFASPQIRNVATLVGNIANASPIADTLPFLYVIEAQLQIHGPKGKRVMAINDFYLGYKKMSLRPGEWISGVIIPSLKKDERLYLYKISQRRDLDISTVNAGFLIRRNKKIEDLRIAYGGVGPTILRLKKTEKFFKEHFSASSLQKAADLVQNEIGPQADLRGSKEFRIKASANLFKKFFIEEAEIL